MLHMHDKEIESNILAAFTQILESNRAFFSDCIVKHEQANIRGEITDDRSLWQWICTKVLQCLHSNQNNQYNAFETLLLVDFLTQSDESNVEYFLTNGLNDFLV